MNPPPNPRNAEARADMIAYNAKVKTATQAAMTTLLDPPWRCRVHVECESGRLTWLSVDVMIDDEINVFQEMPQ